MKKQFRAVVNDQFQIDLNGKEALVYQKISDTRIHAIDERASVNAEIVSADFQNKKYSFRIHASVYEVALSNELDLLIGELGFLESLTSISNEMVAPMPGLIVEVMVKPGAEIQKGDGLLVLEAMKMENTLTATRNGMVKNIMVKAGEAVEKGAVMIEFEKDEENK